MLTCGYKKKSRELKGYSDYWIVKLDNNGNKLWDKSFGGIRGQAIDEVYFSHEFTGFDTLDTGYSSLKNIVASSDGGYILGGSTDSSVGGDNTSGNRDVLNYNGSDLWILKIDKDGNKVWDTSYGDYEYDYNTYDFNLTTIVSTTDGGYLLGGEEYTYEKNYEMGYLDVLLVKINSAGKKVWDRTLILSDYPRFMPNTQLKSILNTKDDGFILGSTSWSEGSEGEDKTEESRGWEDYWIIKLDSGGNRTIMLLQKMYYL